MDRELPQLDPLQKLLSSIQSAPENLRKEFAESKNNWLACFGTRLTSIKMWLTIVERNGLLTADKILEVKTKFQELTARIEQLKTEENDNPDDATKEELLKQLSEIYQ